MLVAPASGTRLVIIGTLVVQETDYISGDSLPAECRRGRSRPADQILKETQVALGALVQSRFQSVIRAMVTARSDHHPRSLDKFLVFRCHHWSPAFQSTIQKSRCLWKNPGLTETTVSNVFTQEPVCAACHPTPGVMVNTDAALSDPTRTLTAARRISRWQPG